MKSMKITDIATFEGACDLRAEARLKSPAWIAARVPRLSWSMVSGRPGARQSAYRIQAASTSALLETSPDLWDSGWVESDRSLEILWGGAPLESRQTVFWHVLLRDEAGHEFPPCETASFEVSLLKPEDWSAKWIFFDGNNPSCSAPCPYFRREFRVEKEVAQARLYVTARGIFEARLNGQRVASDHFVPGWTDFKKQIQFMTYDVTALIQPGVNAAGAVLGDGWYCGYLSGRKRNTYGKYPELLFQLEISFRDGSSLRVVSGDGWKTATGPILSSDIYDGENHDARLEMPGWDLPGFDDSAWRSAKTGEGVSAVPALVAKCCPPVRRIMELKPVRILNPRKDLYIWDFGQNISGRMRVKLKGYAGRLYTFRFGEMLNADDTLYNLNYRSARSTDSYTCRGPVTDFEEWEPLFTFHGFRYLQIDGFQFSGTDVSEIEATAIVMHSDLEVTGEFECGSEKVNRLYSNVCWGQRDNFFEIPTDCPQRDERLGWTGDAHVFVGAASFNMDVSAFFHKWMRDVRDAQLPDGSVTCIAPALFTNAAGAAVWADAAVGCPWTIYRRFGDRMILEESYDSMKKWVDFQENTSNELIRPDTAFGDWLALSPVSTPSALIGTAMFAYTSRILGKAAAVLGKKEEAVRYGALSGKVAEAFRREFLDADGFLKIKSQTACVLALQFDLLDEDQKKKQIDLLASLIRGNGNKLNTGFVGTAWLTSALTRCGRTDVAYDLLLQEEYPSWLFSVNQGATTIWERWNSYTLKDGFGDVNMNSFNHYAYGAVAEWMAATVGGIDLAEEAPGGKEIVFAAEPDRRLGHVRTALQTPFGRAESAWRYEGDSLVWRISAPANTRAKVILPCGDPGAVKMNGAAPSAPITENGRIVLLLENGTYEFIIQNIR